MEYGLLPRTLGQGCLGIQSLAIENRCSARQGEPERCRGRGGAYWLASHTAQYQGGGDHRADANGVHSDNDSQKTTSLYPMIEEEFSQTGLSHSFADYILDTAEQPNL